MANRDDPPVNQIATLALTADGRLSDGHLVQYPFEGPWSPQNAYWASGTVGAGSNVTLNLDDDGHLYLFNSSTIIRNLTNGGYPKERRIYLVRNDVDDNRDAKCLCIPGFEFVDLGRWNAGCVRNSTFRSCKNDDGSIEYNMWELTNTCKMQGLLLRFGRSSPGDPNMALVKMESGPNAERDPHHLPKENMKELEF
ncbi:hypothetical protein LguiA_013471 [Lonicera macranthoides]